MQTDRESIVENVEKLSAIMKNMQQNNKSAEPQEILQEIKKKIANNYNNLYENYEQNKQQIIRNIQKTQNNHSNQNIAKLKFDNAVKQKNFYDKLKVQIQVKQKKLKIMQALKEQLKVNSQPAIQQKQILDSHLKTVQKLESQKEVLIYETAVLLAMKSMRGDVKLNLKQRHQNLLNEEVLKKQKIGKIKDIVHTKKAILNKIKDSIETEEQEKIPMPLTVQLQKKLQEYEGRYAQQNILIHENRLSKEKQEMQKQLQLTENEKLRHKKFAKYQQDKREYNIIYNHYIIKKSQEQKIKKLCRVEAITDVADGSLANQRSNLEGIQQQIQNQIQNLNKQNEEIKKQLEQIMTAMSSEENQENGKLLEMQQQLQQEESQLKRLKSQLCKKQHLINEWQSSFITIFNIKCDKDASEKIEQCIQKYEGYSNREKYEGLTVPQGKQQKNSIKLELHKKLHKPIINFPYGISASVAGSENDF